MARRRRVRYTEPTPAEQRAQAAGCLALVILAASIGIGVWLGSTFPAAFAVSGGVLFAILVIAIAWKRLRDHINQQPAWFMALGVLGFGIYIGDCNRRDDEQRRRERDVADARLERAARESRRRERDERIRVAEERRSAIAVIMAMAPGHLASIAEAHVDRDEPALEQLCFGEWALARLPSDATGRAELRRTTTRARHQLEERERREAAEARGVICRDGDDSDCSCYGNHRGCCSGHGGVAGCTDPIPPDPVECPAATDDTVVGAYIDAVRPSRR